MVVLLGLWASGCQPALKPGGSYPADWPAVNVLGPGFAELNGTYANEGTATTTTGGTVPFAFTSLVTGEVAGRQPWGEVSAAESGGRVELEVVPSHRLQPYPRLKVTVTEGAGAWVRELEAGSDRNALLYMVELDGPSAGALGFYAGRMAVLLTTSADGSLIARVSADTSGPLEVLPADVRSEAWLRFERVSA